MFFSFDVIKSKTNGKDVYSFCVLLPKPILHQEELTISSRVPRGRLLHYPILGLKEKMV